MGLWGALGSDFESETAALAAADEAARRRDSPPPMRLAGVIKVIRCVSFFVTLAQLVAFKF
jgi:hypothetical protein